MDWNVLVVGTGNSTFLIPVKFPNHHQTNVILFVVLLAHSATTPLKEDMNAKNFPQLMKFAEEKLDLEKQMCVILMRHTAWILNFALYQTFSEFVPLI